MSTTEPSESAVSVLAEALATTCVAQGAERVGCELSRHVAQAERVLHLLRDRGYEVRMARGELSSAKGGRYCWCERNNDGEIVRYCEACRAKESK